MSRRVKLPGADELFGGGSQVVDEISPVDSDAAEDRAPRGSTGRVRHDEKITVYMSEDELLDLEHARLTLRRHYGLAVDRGRIVRAALHLAISEVEVIGDESALVRRLSEPA